MKLRFLFLLIVMLLITVVCATAISTDGLISGFTMDNANVSGSTSLDVYSSNDGTFTGLTTGAIGLLNEAYLYDNNEDYIEWTAGTFADGDFSSGGSVSVWFNMSSKTDNNLLFSWPGRFYGFYNSGAGLLTIYFYDGADNYLYSLADLNTDQFYHMVVTWDNTQADLYLDNVLQDSNLNADDPSLDDGRPFCVGESDSTVCNGASNDFGGLIDQLLIFNYPLTTDNVSDLYNSGSGIEYPFTETGEVFLITANDSLTGADLYDFNVTTQGFSFASDLNGDVAFNDSQDWTINNYNPVANNASFVPHGGRNGTGAYSFDGTQNINIGTRENLQFESNSVTVCSWTYSEPTITQQSIIDGGNLVPRWEMDVLNGNLLTGHINFGVGVVTLSYAYNISNEWYHTCMVMNISENMTLYLNGSKVASKSLGAVTNLSTGKDLYIGSNEGTGLFFTGLLDEVTVFNKALSAEEIKQVMIKNLSNVKENLQLYIPFGMPEEKLDFSFNKSQYKSLLVSDWNTSFDLTGSLNPLFKIFAVDLWSNASISNFSASINGTNYTTGTGSLTTDIAINAEPLNITIFNITNYLNKDYFFYNFSNHLTAQVYQADICLNATEKITGLNLSDVTFFLGANETEECFNLSIGSYNITSFKEGWFNQTQEFTLNYLEEKDATIENLTYANLTIYAVDGETNQSLDGYEVSISSIDFSSWAGEERTGVTNTTFNLINGTYNVSLNVPGYAPGDMINITVDGVNNYTFTLFKTNSVRIYIWDEITGLSINENVSIRWASNTTTWENITNTGQLFIHNLTPDNYELLFYSSNYSTRSYIITVGNQSTQVLNAYMISSSYTTIFTVKDIDTGASLPDVAMSMYKQINSSWVAVESKYSDISGKAQFSYDPIASYKFYLVKGNYTDYIFYLNPILFAEYDVLMSKTNLINYSVDFEGIGVLYSPTQFINDESVPFNFIISSPDGLLTDYGLRLDYPGGSSSAYGNNAIGGQLTANVNLSNASSFDYVTLNYNYTTSLSGLRSFTITLPITVNNSAGTWMHIKDRTYGMGIFERVLIATLIILFVVGIATMVGQVVPGFALGLFVYGMLAYIGFIPLWAILPSMTIGLLFLVWKSGGY